MVASFAVIYLLVGLFRHWNFASGFDLAIFDQAIWHMSRFETPASTVSGYGNILGDHFYPILGLFAPLYWIVPAPETLIVAQALLLAASIVPVYLFARTRLPEGSALGLSVAYGLFWGMQRTAMMDIHEMAFAPLFIATAILAIDQRRWRRLWIMSALLVLVKEDLIPLVAAFGALLILRRQFAQGAALLGGGLGVFVAVLAIVIPYFNEGVGWSTRGAFGHVWERPWAAPVLFVTPPGKLLTILNWLAPFAFLPLRSPYALLLIPIAASRLLSASPSHWGAGSHYSAPLAPILVMSAADGLARIAAGISRPEPRRKVIVAAVGASVVIAAIVPGHQPHWRLFRAAHYQAVAARRAAPAALAVIPRDAAVVAQAPILPHLSQRVRIYVLKRAAPDAEYVVAAPDLDPWPMTRPELADAIAQFTQRGYAAVFDRDGWIVLRRGGG
jgi:uncharacterized membrane protein